MYQNILIATDGSDIAMRAAEQGVALAKSVGAKVTAVTVTQPFHWFGAELSAAARGAYEEGVERTVSRSLGAVAATAKAANVACETVHVEQDHPYIGIIETARARNCDLIVMGSHGRGGLSAIVLGSHTVKVLTHAKIPVLVCR